MSLSADDKKLFWRDHKDSLNRIRSQLEERDSPVRQTSPRKSPIYVGKSHSPLGLYRKTTSPAHLPRIETPPEHDAYRENKKLRGSKYDIVPPVQSRRSRNHPTPDYDSWGEESSDDEDEPQYFMPQPYPVAAYGYPAYQPPQVVYGQPFPVYYPPPPVYRERGKKRGKGKRPADKLEVHQSYPGRKSRKNAVQFSVPNGYHIPKEPRVFDETRNDVLRQYKYIYPRDSMSPYTPVHDGQYGSHRYKDDLDSLMYFYFKDHPLFAEGLTDWLIEDLLEEIIPDILIETLTEIDNLPKKHPFYYPSIRVTDELFDEVMTSMTREAVRGALGDMVNDYMGYDPKITSEDPLEGFLDRLMEEAIQDSTEELVKDTVKEMVSDHMRGESAAMVLDDLVEDHIEDIQKELIDDIILELVIEEFLDEFVIEPLIEEEYPEIAKEVLEVYDTKVEKRELKEVSKQAGDKLMESIVLQYLLSLISRQGKVWNESDHANKYMDDMILNILIAQYNNVNMNRDKTVTNKPLRKLHEKVVSDVALDLLLQQLSGTLDEDLADVDEYERGLDNYNFSSTPTTKGKR